MGSNKFLFLLMAIIFYTGCLSGPLPEELPTTAPPITPAPLTVRDLSFISFDTLVIPERNPEFANLSPEIEGFVGVPFSNPVDVVSNDLGVLSSGGVINASRRLQILASILSRYNLLYLRPENRTDTMVYYTIYKMNDSAAAENLLDAYRREWNRRAMNVSDMQIWIWDGYIEESAGQQRPFSPTSILYWNPEQGTSFFGERIIKDHPTLSMAKTTLYSVHGETALGPYFIMIDIKTELPDIQNKTASIFTEMLNEIRPNVFPGDVELSPANITVEDMRNAEIEVVKGKLRGILEDLLSGGITKEEYDALFEEYTLELNNLTAS